MRTLVTGIALLLLSANAAAQNILLNPGFELHPTTVPLDNLDHRIDPWLTDGGRSNVVEVDSGDKITSYASGPLFDATEAPRGTTRHYLDLAPPGAPVVFQTFIATCTGDVDFGGFFSRRQTSGPGEIALRLGAGAGGPVVAATSPVTPPAGERTWVRAAATARLIAGTTYSFVVTMADDLNFDEAFVRYTGECGAIASVDPCCPPWNEARLEEMVRYESFGKIADPYTLRLEPEAAFQSQMQAYVNYLTAISGILGQISITFRLHDSGTGADPVPGAVIVAEQSMTWSGGGSTPSAPTFPPDLLQVNRWYSLRTTIGIRDGQKFFSDSCGNADLHVRVQVRRSSGAAVLQIRGADGRVAERTYNPRRDV